LYANQIGDAGAFAIADAIRQSTSLVTVILAINGIGFKGVVAIVDAIKQSASPGLFMVDVRGNSAGVGGPVATALVDARQAKPTIKIFCD